MTQQILFQEEKSYVRNEGIGRFHGNPKNSPLTRDRPRPHTGPQKKDKREILLMDHFDVVWNGTQQRRANDIQRCYCGELTVFQGKKLSHEGSHCKQLRRNYDF